MAKITNEIIVVDLEATCWETEPPAGQVSEIIEIGIAVLSRDTHRGISGEWNVIGGESILIKPKQSTVSSFCTDLTSITQSELDSKGIDLFDACRKLENIYDSRHKGWASWGDYDRKQFEKQCKGYVRYPFSDTHWNMKSLYSLLRKLDREIGMKEALKLEGLKMVGTHHRGVDDALNTARILQRIL